MTSLLKKMRGDKKGWYKVSDLRPGVEIATPAEDGSVLWDEIVSITPVGREQVYDIEVEGTHNFIGNGIFAHNTYVLRANTTLAVEGQIYAGGVIVPAGSVAGATSTPALEGHIPAEVLTAGGEGIDLYKLATYNLSVGQALAEKVDAHEMRLVSLEERVNKLESGAISTAGVEPVTFSTTSLASALQSFGALIEKNVAQFKTLVASRFVALPDESGASSAGSATILAGSAAAQVANALVAPTTKIFVTFNSQIIGGWWVSDKADGSFRVVLSEPQAGDVSFDYFLVQTEMLPATDSSPEVMGNSGQVIVNSPDTSLPDDSASTTPDNLQPTTSGGDVAPPAVSGDVTSPVVTLISDAALQINVGDAFTDPGATATDDTDGDLTTHINVSGAVDTATAGLYELTYSATDAAGNTGSVSRVVTVVAPPPTDTPPAPADTPSADSGADTSNVTP